MSHLVRADLREPLRGWFPDDEDYKRAFDAYEYRSALLVHTTHAAVPRSYAVMTGEFIVQGRWTDDDRPRAEQDFVTALSRAADEWAWWPVLGGRDGSRQVLDDLREMLRRHVLY